MEPISFHSTDDDDDVTAKREDPLVMVTQKSAVFSAELRSAVLTLVDFSLKSLVRVSLNDAETGEENQQNRLVFCVSINC